MMILQKLFKIYYHSPGYDLNDFSCKINIDPAPPPGRTSKLSEGEPNEAKETASIGNEKNYTDPKVCHDPSIQLEGIARLFFNQNL